MLTGISLIPGLGIMDIMIRWVPCILQEIKEGILISPIYVIFLKSSPDDLWTAPQKILEEYLGRTYYYLEHRCMSPVAVSTYKEGQLESYRLWWSPRNNIPDMEVSQTFAVSRSIPPAFSGDSRVKTYHLKLAKANSRYQMYVADRDI